MPGPPPQPNERKRRLGNPGGKPLPDPQNVIALAPATAETPTQLGDAGAEIWRRVTSAAVWLAESDKPTLELLCEKVDRRADFVSRLADDDPVLYTDKGYAYAHPLVGMLSTLETEIAKLYGALGLTPTDRTRMGLAEVKARNAFEEMLARKQGS